ncbi:Rqc2 family fibronectin-binding protein [Salisediminibacterium selenitireducens]|uniref:Rqc2 homolog RqcH n=1 Tax=Bacillus selenitireducens (strain ATCC 700615 / DSM 15326 / MLS10) TaxID=439292 RepID=D6XTQ7_BACIE|nr:NFACT RNA binding domain-containing protein [Salisediminibacterium selenitireducens]ADH99193.1 Fibronectin-binding A domain protein [[Bacillus] selenitireducens MLS10]
MSFDGTVTRAVTDELANTIQSGRITKIHQPDPSDIMMTIRAHGKNHQLFFSVNPNFARFHLTKLKFTNPQEPPMFTMVLRKHLEGSILESIEQDGLERIVTFSFKGRNELGDVSYKILILELMGRHSNLIFVDKETGTILDSLKHIPPSVSKRTVMPGQPYSPPPYMDKLNPLDADEELLRRKIDYNAGKVQDQIRNLFAGLSPQIIREIQHRAGLINRDSLPQAFTDTMEPLKQGEARPQIIRNEKETFSVIDLTHLSGNKDSYDNTSVMLDAFYENKAERDRVRQQAHDLERFLRNEYQKNKKKLKKLEQTLNDTEKAQDDQKNGELVTAHMHQIQPGDKTITVIDYYEEEQPEKIIPLDPDKSPSENAQQFFKRYRKRQTAAVHVKKQLKQAKEEMAYLDTLIQHVEMATTEDIAEIRNELEAGGYLKKKKTSKKPKKPQKPKPEKYLSSEEIEIYVGKNNIQNEYVTNRMARQNDTWLHTKDIPGSHVVIRSETFGEKTLHEAANLAAYFSKSRLSGQVPVDYTLIRHVRKPNGAKPGYVTYEQQNTLFVTPDEELVKRCRDRAKQN